MLGSRDVIAFVGTRDSARARAFYEGALGLRLVADEPSALVFDAGGRSLRVSKVREVARAEYTVLGWNVPDIRAAMTGLKEKGVAFERFSFFPQDDAGVWTAPDGTKVAWFRDPDGNLLSLTEFPRRPGKP